MIDPLNREVAEGTKGRAFGPLRGGGVIRYSLFVTRYSLFVICYSVRRLQTGRVRPSPTNNEQPITNNGSHLAKAIGRKKAQKSQKRDVVVPVFFANFEPLCG
jgi:hypothetical protein